MPGPRVASTRPDPNQTAGTFTKAFSEVMDAIAAGKQAEALMEQVKSTERSKNAEAYGKFLEKIYDKRVAEVGSAQAGMELADDFGEFFQNPGMANRLKKVFAEGNENPGVLAGRWGRVLFGSTPEQQLQLQQSFYEPEPSAPTEEGEAPSPTTSPTVTPTPPTDADLDEGPSMVVGPSTPQKVEATKSTFEGAMAAMDAIDISKPQSIIKAVAGLRTFNSQAAAGATTDNRKEAVLANTFGHKRVELWKAAFGDDWANTAIHYMMGDQADYQKTLAKAGGGDDLRTLLTFMGTALGIKSNQDIAEMRDKTDRQAQVDAQQKADADRAAKVETERKAQLVQRITNLEDNIKALKSEYKDDPEGAMKDPRWTTLHEAYAQVSEALTGVAANKIYQEIRTETGRSKFYNGLRGLFKSLPEQAEGSFLGPTKVETVPAQVVPQAKGGDIPPAPTPGVRPIGGQPRGADVGGGRPTPAPTPTPTPTPQPGGIPPFAPQQPGESNDAYMKRLRREGMSR